MQGYVNLKGYDEFDAHARPSGYSVWLTFSISPAAPASPAVYEELTLVICKSSAPEDYDWVGDVNR